MSRKSTTQAVSFRADSKTLERLEHLAAATDRSRSWHIEQALDAYLEVQAWQVERIERGIAALDAGDTVPHEAVRDWLLNWGGDSEGEPPA